MESSIFKSFCVYVFFVYFLFQCKLIFPSQYSLLYIPHSVMSTFSHTVYINSMKQKGLPLVCNKAAPCTVLSHSLVDSAPHVHQTHTDTHILTEATRTPPTYGTSHILLLCSLPPPIGFFSISKNPCVTSSISPRVQAFCLFTK